VTGLLQSLDGPDDLKRLDAAQLPALAREIREFLIAAVARTGGHLGPNLGVVELTIAMHRVFDSPHDVLLWDTGHQAYVHKLLTGRADGFGTLRQEGGLSGYPSRAESAHDVIENSHASTALSYADGFAKAFALLGEREQHRGGTGSPGRHRGQRQRPVLRPDCRRPRRPSQPAATVPVL
jgi:1-deoxy-D-xylulose-5-phosphate synthase